MFWKKIKKHFRKQETEIHPDEIFLDSRNLPEFDTYQFEGRIERPISTRMHVFIGAVFLLIALVFLSRLVYLQINKGEILRSLSENNRLRHSYIFAERGVVYDRRDKLMAWNASHPEGEQFSIRQYTDAAGVSLLLGYVKYPGKDSAGFYYSDQYDGKDGVEKYFNAELSGKNGLKIIETDAVGRVVSENIIDPPVSGKTLHLSIDSELSEAFFVEIEKLALEIGFKGGAAAIMDITNGEVVAMTSYPEYSSDVLSQGKDKKTIESFINDGNNPFLDRLSRGLYTPGSIIKPFIAIAALAEGVIDPSKKIVSTGSITLPNIYDETKSTVFRDWKAHGAVDMREAIAVSSDVYFYEIGGGYEEQKGLGITLIDKYMRLFGFGRELPVPYFGGMAGTIPNPKWKAENFEGEEWTVGNTYHTSIGQYGFLVTPMQALVATAAVANNGRIVYPEILKGVTSGESGQIDLDKSYFEVAKDGMRLSVVIGTASALNVPYMKFAGKTGTAELGAAKQYVNSWVTGFFPYDEPKYAFVVIMEKGPRANTVGASAVARRFFDWASIYRPDLFE